MGETEMNSIGVKVCRPHKVDRLSSGSKQPVAVAKLEPSVTSVSPSPPPLTKSSPESPFSESLPESPLSETQPESPLPSNLQPQSSTPKTYDCQTCGKKFSKPSKLKNHLHLHTGQRPFACKHPGCDKAYTNSSHLLRHMKSHQGKVYTLQMCLECKALFRSSGGLQKHMKTVHMTENEYPYACSECGRAFRKKKQLTYHMVEHGGNPAFRCGHCDVQFTHKYLYNRHMRGHKTHPCRHPGCSEVLANWSLFRKHMAVHNQETNFTVEVFCEEDEMMKATAKGEVPLFKEVPKKRVPGRRCPECNMIITSRNRYYSHLEQHKAQIEVLKCPHAPCDRVYSYKRNLDHHIRTHHTEKKRFLCNICGRSLISKQKLQMHMDSIHSGKGKTRRYINRSMGRSLRKDRGTIKRALAPRLAGIEIPFEEEQRLLHEDEEFRLGDPLSLQTSQSPESGFSSSFSNLPGILSALPGQSGSDIGVSCETEESYRTGDPLLDSSDLQGPSETQRRNEEQQESSSEEDEDYIYSGGDDSDNESGSGHCEDEEDDDGDGDDGEDDDEGDDDDDDFNEDEDDDEGEEANEPEEEDEEEKDDGHLAQGDGSNGKKPGNENFSKEEIEDGCGDFGVDRDSTIPSVESNERETITGDVEDDRTSLKRKNEADEEEVRKKQKVDGEESDEEEECILPDSKQLDRNVDASILEVKIAKEKASKRLPEDVWLNTFKASIDNCLPTKSENDSASQKIKQENS